MAVFPNKFAKCCNNPNCPDGWNKRKIPVKQGFIQKTDAGWLTWCKICCPEPTGNGQRCELTVEGHLYTPYDVSNVTLIRSLPQPRTWNKGGNYWEVSLAPEHRTRLLEVCGKLGAKVPAELKVMEQTAVAKAAAQDDRLFAYQIEGINWLAQRDHGLLGDDMGLGKTVQMIKSSPADSRVIVVCPGGLKFNWRDEVQKWTEDRTVTVLEGRGTFRIPEPGEFVIISRECLPKYLEQKVEGKGKNKKYISQVPKEIEKALADCILVGDEVHGFKNYKTARAKRYSHLSRLVAKSYHLTGTPLLNKPQDLFGVLCACNLIRETFGTFERFARLWGADRGRFGHHWPLAPAIIPETLRRVMLRRTKPEVLPQLPSKRYHTLPVNDLPDNLARDLDAAYDRWVEWEEENYGELPKGVRPRNLPPFESFSKIRRHLAESRIPAMLNYVEECEEQEVPLVVFSAHRAPIDELKGREGWEVITGGTPAEKRQEICRRFNNGELLGVGVTITAGGVGLNLTHASTALFVDLDWVPANVAQAEDRLVRIGQLAQSVMIVRMVSNHPLDRHVLSLLADKIAMIQSAIEHQTEAGKTGDPNAETEDDFEARMERKAIMEVEAEADARIKAENKTYTGFDAPEGF